MRYSLEITIDLPRDKVIELFMNPNNMKYWQKGFISRETYRGEPGKEGARSKLEYAMDKRVIEMTETLTKVNLPEEVHGTYNAGNVYNWQFNYFSEVNSKTIWRSESKFKFSGFMKIISFLTGSKPFQNQSYQYMEDFKAFAEGNPPYNKGL